MQNKTDNDLTEVFVNINLTFRRSIPADDGDKFILNVSRR